MGLPAVAQHGKQRGGRYQAQADHLVVNVQQAISHDTKERRFDEGRSDEFGFFAKFINRSLEVRDRQTRELQSALDQIWKSEAELFKSTSEWTYTMEFIDDPMTTLVPVIPV